MPTKYKILIVDDEHENLRLMAFMLESSNEDYTILLASNADIAIRIAKIKLPDIIITDWNMAPKDGIELIKELKQIKLTKDIPIIVATGFMLTSENLKTALDAGAVDYIRKPINSIELAARTHSALSLSKSYKENIRLKDKELNENALYLIRCNEFNMSLIEKLKRLDHQKGKNIKLVNDIIMQIDSRIKSDTWERFDISFQAIYSNFYKNLLEKFPTLTNADLKLSSLLMLGMNTKNIASILNQTSDSIKVARYRLRKKLNLNSKENLQIFLSSI